MENRNSPELDAEVKWLEEHGINLFAILSINDLPDKLRHVLSNEGWSQERAGRLILFGNGGQQFWNSLHKHPRNDPDPIDNYSRDLAEQFATRVLARYEYQLLYPGGHTLPLQQLGTIAGWHHPSPMGIGIEQK